MTISTWSRSRPATTPTPSWPPGARGRQGRLRREAAGPRRGRAAARSGGATPQRSAADRRVQPPARAAGRRASPPSRAEADGLPRQRRASARRSLDQRPRQRRRAAEGRGVPLHRLSLRPGRKRPGDRERPRLPFASRPPVGGDGQLQRRDRLCRRWRGHASLRGRRAGRPRQGALRDQLARRLRGPRGLSARARLARAPKRRLGGGRQDKGFAAQFEFLAELARGRVEAPPPESFLLSGLATLAAARSLESGHPETVVSSGERDRRARAGAGTGGGSHGWCMVVSRGDEKTRFEVERLEMETRGSMSIQPGERERARFDVPPPDHERGPG